jgi:hypothetical protein
MYFAPLLAKKIKVFGRQPSNNYIISLPWRHNYLDYFVLTLVCCVLYKKELNPSFQVESSLRNEFYSTYHCRGFKVFYNRRYFLNFRRYLKN